MSQVTNETPIPANRLLAKLPKQEYLRLLPKLKNAVLTFGDVLYDPGDTIKYVYFPNDSIVSLLSAVAERSTLEVGMVGNEGMAGLPIFMGVNVSSTRALVQASGTAVRMTSAAVRAEANHLGALHRLLHRYSHSLMTQISQSSACNRFHPVEARLARWLLMTRDRVGADEFRLTQDFMSNMLGVRREGVNKAAGALQAQQLIRYSRGGIKVLDGPSLEAAACVCYALIRTESDSYLN
jgi:CRP-like cAMP-binding protein